MAEQEGKPALMIQLPWTVPQQPNVQTIVLQQPAKTHMELNASTDKTAISSFALSVIIALILGSFATWLAYWYGRKSFDLTKQSFDSVIMQIKSSERTSLDLNAKLFDQQKILQNNELNFKKMKSWEDKVRELGAEYITSITQFIYHSRYFEINYLSSKLTDRKNSNTEGGLKYLELKDLTEKCILLLAQLDLYFEVNEAEFEKIILIGDMFNESALTLLEELSIITMHEQLIVGSDEFPEEIIKMLEDDGEDLSMQRTYTEVLSYLMRKINKELKIVIGRKGE